MILPTIKLDGTAAIARAFKRLGPKIGAKPVRKGARAGAKVFAAAIRRRAPVGRRRFDRDRRGKQLKDQVRVRALKRRRGEILIAATTGGATLNAGDAFYGAMLEYGRGPGGWHESRLSPLPFIRPAFDAAKAQANRIAVQTIVRETNAELAKL
jgi:HK97 gp10 family phage protein